MRYGGVPVTSSNAPSADSTTASRKSPCRTSTRAAIPFHASDRYGGDYLLTPLYRAEDESGELPRRTFAAADCIGLLTAEGRSAKRTGKGRYRLLAGVPDAGTELFGDDVHAP